MFGQAHELAEHAEQLVQTEPDVTVRQEVNLVRLFSSFHLGDLAKTRELVARAIDLYANDQSGAVAFSMVQDLRTTTSSVIVLPLWLLGHADQARHWAENAIALATSRGDHFALSQCLAYSMVLDILRGDRELLRTKAEVCNRLCTDHGFPFFHSTATMVRGHLLVEDGDAMAGIALMRTAWDAREAAGQHVNATFWFALTASAYAQAGAFDQALDMLAKGFEVVRSRGERWWEPELHRLTGAYYMRAHSSADRQVFEPRRDDGDTPEAAYTRALELARKSGAKSLELRAATSLARLWRNGGKHHAARRLLESVYGGFTEGHATMDHREARAELGQLGNESASV